MSNIYTDANNIFKAGKKAIAGAPWKHSSQLFEMNQLLETAKLQKEIQDREYRPEDGKMFWINERGKHRHVTSISCRDKTVNHVICDEVLTPYLDKYLIHDNGASREGKGVAFFRRRFEQHVREFYHEHGNKGFILLGDFRNYYGSIDSAEATDMILDLLSEDLPDDVLEETEWFLRVVLGDRVGINIGGQPSQNVGITYAHKVDDYVKTVKGFRYYARYSDDFYVIGESKEILEDLKRDICEVARKNGLQIHPHKTHITRIDEPFRILQISYRLTESGKLVKRISPKAVTRERRRLKAYRRLVEHQRMTTVEARNAFKSWMMLNFKNMSGQQIRNMNDLYVELFGEEITWKNSRLRYLTGRH